MASVFNCDYVKFQKRDIDLVYEKDFLDSPRKSQWGETQRDQKKGLEFYSGEYDCIDYFCGELEQRWFASIWDVNGVEFVSKYDNDYIKIPSACITDFELLEKVKATGIPVIMSVGMSDLPTIEKAVKYMEPTLEYLLWCKSSYPTPDKEMNMSAFNEIKSLYGKRCRVGFSNHSQKVIYCVQAALMGAEMIEFHVTLDRGMAGSDQKASISPVGLDRINRHIMSVCDGFGDGSVRVEDSEVAVLKKLRKVK